MSELSVGALDGIVVGVTAERRAEEFITALERHGAQVRHAPTISIVPLAGDANLRAATENVLAQPVDLVVITTGAGFRGWLDAAEGWGLPLVEALAPARFFVRGPKAMGAVRGRGLTEEWSAASETNAELFSHVASLAAGKRVAVQLHGTALPEYTGMLSAASVIEVQPYRWQWPADLSPAHSLIDGVLDGSVGVLAFTSAPAAANLLTLARERGVFPAFAEALRTSVTCACVGSVTAAPLEEIGVTTLQPERARLGALVKLLVSQLGTG